MLERIEKKEETSKRGETTNESREQKKEKIHVEKRGGQKKGRTVELARSF